MEIWRCKFRCVGSVGHPNQVISCWVCKEAWCLPLSWWKKSHIQLDTFPRLLPLIGLLRNSTFLNSPSDFFQKELVKQNSLPISPEIQYILLQVKTAILYLLYIIFHWLIISKTDSFSCLWAEHQKYKYGLLIFPLNRAAHKHHSDSRIKVFWNVLQHKNNMWRMSSILRTLPSDYF